MVHLLLIVIYLAFIGLGLPDSMLGAAWPTMFGLFGVPVSYAGIVSMIISAGTIVSSLMSDFLTKKIGAGLVTAFSVCLTALALFGFSLANSFWLLCVLAVPYGLGAGSVDAALNNYVALHYSNKHMNWLHCMWGVGTIVGPSIMGAFLIGGQAWNLGYLTVALIQIAISAILFFSLRLWKKPTVEQESGEKAKPLSLAKVVKIKGAVEVMVTFFCYCALESTAMLWSSSYLVLHNGVSEEVAAACASIFFIGITVGRFINGFISEKLTDTQMIRMGQSVMLVGIVLLFFPLGEWGSYAGIILLGLGCAPVYPSIIHSTPERFGADKSQALIGVQMASAYTGSCLMPPLFGLIANHVNIALFPVFLLFFLLLMATMHEVLVKKTKPSLIEK